MGGVSILAHPYWKPIFMNGYRMDTPENLFVELGKDRRFTGLELVSGSPQGEWNVSALQASLAREMLGGKFDVPVIMIKVDISNIWGEISLPDLLGLEKEIFDAHNMLTDGTGAGSDYLGWLDLPVRKSTEEMTRILSAAEHLIAEGFQPENDCYFAFSAYYFSAYFGEGQNTVHMSTISSLQSNAKKNAAP